MRNHILATIALAAVAFGGVVSTASADQIQYGNGSWTAAATGAVLVAKLSSGTALLETDLGDVSCTTSTARGGIGSDGGAGNTTNVTGSVTHLTFTGCTDSSSIFNLRNCTGTSNPVKVNIPAGGFPVVVDADSTPDTFTISNLDIDVCIDPVLGSNADCKFTGSASGTVTGNIVSFSQEPVTSTTGFPCWSSATFTAAYDVRVDTNGNGQWDSTDAVIRLVD